MVAVVEAGDPEGAAAAVKADGRQVSQLAGREAAARLRPNHAGLMGALSTAAAAFGDELRVVDEIEVELRQGRWVLVISGGEVDGISRILREHGARSVWEFGKWTFTRTADEKAEGTGTV